MKPLEHFKPMRGRDYFLFMVKETPQICTLETATYCPDTSGMGTSYICDQCGKPFTQLEIIKMVDADNALAQAEGKVKA